MRHRATVFCISVVTLIGFARADDHRHGARPMRGGIKQAVDTPSPGVTPRFASSGVPYYTDNFDGANDTTALKNRGYLIHFRGTGRDNTNPLWFQGNPAVFTAFNGPSNGYLAANYQTVSGANTIDNWLVLPALPVLSGDSLIFYERSPANNSFPDSIAVLFSATGDSMPEGTSWQTLGYFRTTENNTWGRRGFRAPSVASGFNARWAIRYLIYDGGPSGTNSNYIGLDALTVEGAAAQNDISSAANISPSGNVQVNIAAAVQAQFTNVGTLPQSGIPVSYSISPGGYSSSRTIASLASGSSTTIPFDAFTPTATGTYTYTIIANLGTDQNRANDTLRGTFNAVAYYGGGGPADGGYYFANSLATGAPSHPTYGWVDPIAGGHTPISTWTSGGTGDDDYFGNTPIGFTFNFFLTNYDSVFIGSNGYLTFGAATGTTASSATIPATATPNNWIAGCAMDLDARQTLYPDARVYYSSSPSQFVVTYYRVHRWTGVANNDSITFQIILYPNGNIKIQYNDALTNNPPPPAILTDALVGIENSGGTAGIQYFNNGSGAPMFGSPLAVEFGTDPNTLPVQLASFRGTILSPTSVRLFWRTIAEVNNYGFYVERRTGISGQFVEVPAGFLAGHGTTNEPHSYQFVDTTLTSAGTYQYRLRQVDLDGTVHYSEPISVTTGTTTVGESTPGQFALLQNYPNPFNPKTEIRYQTSEISHVSLRVFDILGREVATLVDAIEEAGFRSVEWNAAGVASGVYYYCLQTRRTDGGRDGTRSDLKRMLLVK